VGFVFLFFFFGPQPDAQLSHLPASKSHPRKITAPGCFFFFGTPTPRVRREFLVVLPDPPQTMDAEGNLRSPQVPRSRARAPQSQHSETDRASLMPVWVFFLR